MKYTLHGTIGWQGEDDSSKFTLVIDYSGIPKDTLHSRAAQHDVISFRRPHKSKGRKHVKEMNGQTYHVNWKDVGKRTLTREEKLSLIKQLEAELANETK